MSASGLLTQCIFLNKYKLECILGRGEFGSVWLAEDNYVRETYAVKIIDSSNDAIFRNLQEAVIGHNLKHKNLVHVSQADVTQENGIYKVVVAMEYLPNGSIAKKFIHGFLPLKTALKSTREVLSGLDHLHSNGILHNDIKPDNILLGNNGEAKLSDYGIAVSIAKGIPSNCYSLHIAPEIFQRKKIDIRTDIYQFGLTLFRLMVGNNFLKAKFDTLGEKKYQEAVLAGTLLTKADFPPFIPDSVRSIILKAISVNPNDRYQTALEMRRALERLPISGEWTVGSTGELVGEDGRIFYFIKEHKIGDLFSLECFKQKKPSGQKRKISNFCKKDIKWKEFEVKKKNFMQKVVLGKL